jgi:hypothetical protein
MELSLSSSFIDATLSSFSQVHLSSISLTTCMNACFSQKVVLCMRASSACTTGGLNRGNDELLSVPKLASHSRFLSSLLLPQLIHWQKLSAFTFTAGFSKYCRCVEHGLYGKYSLKTQPLWHEISHRLS